MIQQDLVNVLANIHNKARDTIALRCTTSAIFRIVGNNLLESLGVNKHDIPTVSETVDILFEQQRVLESHATLSYLLIPDKPKIEPIKKNWFKRLFNASNKE